MGYTVSMLFFQWSHLGSIPFCALWQIDSFCFHISGCNILYNKFCSLQLHHHHIDINNKQFHTTWLHSSLYFANFDDRFKIIKIKSILLYQWQDGWSCETFLPNCDCDSILHWWFCTDGFFTYAVLYTGERWKLLMWLFEKIVNWHIGFLVHIRRSKIQWMVKFFTCDLDCRIGYHAIVVLLQVNINSSLKFVHV